ncbi:5-bromo-4-chloroindolyl phosphate hydrolysis family protein [Pseudooceanicola onchidii]|uniref:5-bromo-4-chloroindolyl phosphate hydrolysis family protein n=1 Tax=Pseudooceanicola onchidii TaxID=2562279 RepID=UPI0010AB28C3|nr:5-bromo-4-chloroindolyl phosphate hydrolysis family protein [Pseudooceanicola onchidii]
MAQRFGGEFSPKGASGATDPKGDPQFRGARRTRAGGRVNLLFLAPFPLIWKAFTSGALLMAPYLAGFGILILAAWLTREGIKAEEAYEARKVARRPALPRKMLASLLTGVGLGVVGVTGHGVIEGVIFGLLGVVLHSMAFGIDPLRNKGMEGVDQHQTDRVARAVDRAEAHLAAMQDAIRRAQDRQLETRVDRFITVARDLFRTVENDPRDLTAARKYLGIYLQGARDATVKFADHYARSRDPQARADYEALLSDLEQNFAARTDRLLSDDASDMTVEIEVLRERLQREGVRPE